MFCNRGAKRSRLCLLTRVGADRRGASAIEFAMLGLPFIVLLVQIVELSLVYLASTTLDNAVAIASRQIQTGAVQSAAAPATAATFIAKICANMGWMQASCASSIQVDVRTETTFGNPTEPDPLASGSLNAAALTFNAGGPGQIVLVRAFLTWPLIMPVIDSALSRDNNGAAVIVSTAAFVNENYG
jgi:Flp pilus assembly protein TadG